MTHHRVALYEIPGHRLTEEAEGEEGEDEEKKNQNKKDCFFILETTKAPAVPYFA